ncbi:MAG: two-component sensor histidine kinase, partial [Actinobacteria bacterium]|nr:two-component sensor histidine kinase [Actinomycetota bacterium]
ASRSGTGSGLGLAIVQEHARAMGGGVRVEDAPSGGAQFVVTLLAAADDTDADGPTEPQP